jgi:hypothetical protein
MIRRFDLVAVALENQPNGFRAVSVIIDNQHGSGGTPHGVRHDLAHNAPHLQTSCQAISQTAFLASHMRKPQRLIAHKLCAPAPGFAILAIWTRG